MVTVKNIDSISHTWGGLLLSPDSEYEPILAEQKILSMDSVFILDLSANKAEVKQDGIVLSVSTAISILSGQDYTVKVSSLPPFAEPNYRTKRDSTSSWATCLEDQDTSIDFILAEERYVTGGEIIYKNAKQGDYLSASVYDIYGGIPELYRSSLCENHPVVASYLVKKWLKPTDGYDSFMIDTYPLNAKITAGLSLRVTYHASAIAGDREVAINYHLTKKL
jgi:hypothetical protein